MSLTRRSLLECEFYERKDFSVSFKVAFLEQSLTSNRCSINIYWLQGGQTIYEGKLGEREIRLSMAEFQKFQYFPHFKLSGWLFLDLWCKRGCRRSGRSRGWRRPRLPECPEAGGWLECGCWKLPRQLVQETTSWADGRDSRRTRGAGGGQVGKLPGKAVQSGGLWAA